MNVLYESKSLLESWGKHGIIEEKTIIEDYNRRYYHGTCKTECPFSSDDE